MKKAFLFSVVSALVLPLALTLTDLSEAAGKGKPGGGATNVNPVIVYVAVSSSGPYNELAVANADGSNQIPLQSSDQVGYFFPAWSPDFALNTPGFQGSVVFEQWSGSVTEPIIDLRLIDVAVSPSGLTTSNVRTLVQNASAAAWSPRGDKIAYVSHETDPNVIHILELTSGQNVLSIADSNNVSDAGWPAWNPAGTHLAYTWDDNNQGEFSIRIREVVATSGEVVLNGEDRELVSSVFGASALDWSRGGNLLAFKAAGAMQIVNVSNGEIEILPETTWADSPTWIPANETALVFMNRNGRSGAGKRKIVMRDLSTQVETVIVERTGYHLYEPDWRR